MIAHSVWQFAFEQPVQISTGKRTNNHNNHGDKAVTDVYKHGAGAGACKCPAQAKNQPAQNVFGPAFIFIGYHNGIALPVSNIKAFNKVNRKCAQNNGGTNDAIHVKRLEAEHLLDAVPGYSF